MHFLYLIQCGDFPYYKVGRADNVATRQSWLQTGSPFELSLVMMCRFDSKSSACQAEAEVHRKLVNNKLHGEWFELDKKQVKQIQQDMLNQGT